MANPPGDRSEVTPRELLFLMFGTTIALRIVTLGTWGDPMRSLGIHDPVLIRMKWRYVSSSLLSVAQLGI